MAQGFRYLVAILDRWSRDVLAWQLSHTLESACYLVAVESALVQGGPEMFTTDQGLQLTSLACTRRLERAGMAIRRDGRGRAVDKLVVERLWRTVTDEHIDRKDYASVSALEAGLERDFAFYHDARLHQRLAYRTPAEVHREP
jgi:putative transposase